MVLLSLGTAPSNWCKPGDSGSVGGEERRGEKEEEVERRAGEDVSSLWSPVTSSNLPLYPKCLRPPLSLLVRSLVMHQ